ncbi:hypothetical protein ACFT8P_35180 [Streptomyces sp. NPDC057101]|uniref:hypothetical protein n=1 Tax=Streptomyces sp. NPDC057101 TaxID=3346020 RepID=UPI003624BBA8
MKKEQISPFAVLVRNTPLDELLNTMMEELVTVVRSLAKEYGGRVLLPRDAVEALGFRLSDNQASPKWAASGLVTPLVDFLIDHPQGVQLLRSLCGHEEPPFRAFDEHLAKETFYLSFLDHVSPSWSDVDFPSAASEAPSGESAPVYQDVDLHEVFDDARRDEAALLDHMKTGLTEQERWDAALRRRMVPLNDLVTHNHDACKKLNRGDSVCYAVYQLHGQAYFVIGTRGIAEVYTYGTPAEQNPVDTGTLTLRRDGKTLGVPSGRVTGAGRIEVACADARWAQIVTGGLRDTGTGKEIIFIGGQANQR